VGAISVPEQIGKISPFGARTMNAPTLLKLLLVSSNPETIARISTDEINKIAASGSVNSSDLTRDIEGS
jgi:hypothetical protein